MVVPDGASGYQFIARRIEEVQGFRLNSEGKLIKTRKMAGIQSFETIFIGDFCVFRWKGRKEFQFFVLGLVFLVCLTREVVA